MATVSSEFAYIQEARSLLAEALIAKFGVQRKDILDEKGNITKEGLYDSSNILKRLHDWTALVTATATFGASLTFKDDGTGDEAGTEYTGAEPKNISYNSIGAASSNHNHNGYYSFGHQSSFAYDIEHDSHYVTFDDSSNTQLGLVNGFVSTYNNSLSSYIINVHRTNNWYVGYSESKTAPTWTRLALTTDIPTSLKNPKALTTFGVSYDGSEAKTVTTATFINQLSEGTSNVTDGTMFVTSWASDNGFADENAINIPYKRKASHLWEYIKNKTYNLYVTALGIEDNLLTWTKTESINKITIPYATKASYIIDSGNHTELMSSTNASESYAGMLYSSGMYMTRTYNDTSAMPTLYGNVLNLAGAGSGLLLLGWSGEDSTTANIYYRSHRDINTGGWGKWRRLFYADELSGNLEKLKSISFRDLNGNAVSYNGKKDVDLKAGTYIAKLPYGFSSWSSNCTWGNTIGTSFASWNDSTGGSIDFRQDNPLKGKMSIKVDGRVYVNEGKNPALSASHDYGFWGIRTPDGENNWIRTPNNGLIPYMSGSSGYGHSSLGTSSWYFSTAYIDTIYGKLQGTATNAYHPYIYSANTWSNWYWSGQLGLPTWLWGSNDGTNMYVYNPRNFSVNYANSAGQLATTKFGHGPDSNVWHKILTFTTNWVGLVTFMYAPEECLRSYWFLGTINVRNGDPYFYIVACTGNYPSMKVVGTSTTSWALWIKGSTKSYDPYGALSILSSSNVTIIDRGILASLTSEPSGTYNKTPTNANLAARLTTVSKTAWGQTYWTKEGIPTDISGNLTGVGNINTKESPAGTIYTNNWFRSIGKTGWYSQTYEGGIYMSDSTWVRVLNKGLYAGQEIRAPYFNATRVNNDKANGSYLFNGGEAKISHIKDQIIFNTGNAIRFGSTTWNWNDWAGLKYDSSKKTIYLGIADNSIFTGNSALDGGTLKFPGIDTIEACSMRLEYKNELNSYSGSLYLNTRGGGDIVMLSSGCTLYLRGVLKSSYSIYAASFYENSDLRLKQVVNNLNVPALKIADLPLFKFIWKKDLNKLTHIGTAALAVQDIFPEVVNTLDDFLTVDYGVLGTIAGIIACREIKKLKEQIKYLENYVGFNNLQSIS